MAHTVEPAGAEALDPHGIGRVQKDGIGVDAGGRHRRHQEPLQMLGGSHVRIATSLSYQHAAADMRLDMRLDMRSDMGLDTGRDMHVDMR